VGEEALETRSPRLSTPVTLTTSAAAHPSKHCRGETREDDEREGVDHVQYLYSKLLELRPNMRDGQADSTEDWLDIADALLRDFRSNRVFFPLQRHMVFLGYSREAQRKAGRFKPRTIMDEVQEMAGRLQASLGMEHHVPKLSVPFVGVAMLDSFLTTVVGTPDIDPSTIPTDYHGISFDDWLDVFLEYALVLAGQGQSEEAYDTLGAAADASIWYHSKQSTCQIYVCWFSK
jgi:general transcription factor 3C polypeptide 3 (transcription factor C subunit 4)